MSYVHALHVLSGVIHALPNDGEWSVCGKGITSSYVDVDRPITCKVCARSIELSRDYRIARELSKLVRELHDDMISRPGAYFHADRNVIREMKLIAEGE